MSLVNAFLLLGNWFWIEERKSVSFQLQTLFELMAILKLIFKTYKFIRFSSVQNSKSNLNVTTTDNIISK